jgi:hypothetical protein
MTSAKKVLEYLDEVETLKGKVITETLYNSIEGLPPKGTYERIGKEIGQLLERKQVSYGNSFGRSCEILKVLYPNGVDPEQFTEMLTVVRIIDKLFRIATDKDQFEEDSFKDIAGYAILMLGQNLREIVE